MPNPTTTVILRANYEVATACLSVYMQTVVDRARQRGFNVVDLLGLDATQTKFFEALELNNPLLVIGAGHGNESGFYGQNDQQILAACQNDEVMSGREGIFNSCSVGVTLGPSMVSKTAKWFAGWRADYIFMYQEGVDPLQDEVLRPFMECIIQPALTRIESGDNPALIYSQTISKFNSWINQWWNSADPVAGEIIGYLIHNRDNFMVTGIQVPAAMGLNPAITFGGLLALAYLFVGKS